jgi:HlyD family secretion protein
VEQLLVKEGDRIKAGQAIAILDSRDRLQAALEQAQEDVRVAQAKLAITQAGAKQGEIKAQRAEITRLEAQRQGDIEAQAATVARLQSQLRNAQTEYARYQSLYQEGAISASNRDSRRLTLETAQKNLQEAQAVLERIRSTSPAQLNQARANLERIAEVRPVDVKANQVEIARAIAAMKQAKAELEKAYVRSPIDGEILDIHTRAGEVVANDGIVEIGQTQQMYAIAEVYQSDISKVKPGQQVRVTSDSFLSELVGTVERIDSQVRRQTIVNTDPSTNIDGRVIEVHVALDAASSKKAAKFTNLQVTAAIKL